MIVNREHVGVTPSGMTFGDLASVTGGGAQTPGFVGVGRLYLTSPKFISGDGGVKRNECLGGVHDLGPGLLVVLFDVGEEEPHLVCGLGE